MKSSSTLALALAFALSAPAVTPAHAGAPATDSTAAGVAAPMSDGIIKKLDKAAGKITIKHGELKNLAMPPMTMVFRVKNPALLEQVNAGDQIRFVVENIGGQFTVMQMEIKK